jgi:signal transduction histidine kinase
LIEIGDHKYILAFDRDITERKLAEEAIKRYAGELEESNKMKELFTDIMHHDLLNPLNTVNGYVEILAQSEKDPQKSSYLRTIERNLHKGIELIESATKFSMLESLESIEFEDVDLREIICQVIEAHSPLASKAGMMIENDTLSMPTRANKIIEEVFANLISNAIKYASSGKKIIVNGYDGVDFWRIRVIDFDEGIKEPDKTLIFERFYRKEKKGVKGSGLGLAIAGRIMELHKGRIWVEDNMEGGAIFVVEIPKYPVLK